MACERDRPLADVQGARPEANTAGAANAGDKSAMCQHVGMSNSPLSESKQFSSNELVGLYESVGWTTYARDPDALVRAVEQSSYVVSYRDAAGKLVGLARAISDDVSVFYLQDILVNPDRQREGIGRALVTRILERYGHVRQQVLLTDDEPAQRAFYESIGFIEAHDFRPAPLRAFVRMLNS